MPSKKKESDPDQAFKQRFSNRCFSCGQFVKLADCVKIDVEDSFPFVLHHECYEQFIKAATDRLAFADRLDVKAHDIIEAWFVYVTVTRIANFGLFIGEYLADHRKPVNKGGRPRMGKTRKLSISLPDEDWEIIDQLIASNQHQSYSEYFRHLHQMTRFVSDETSASKEVVPDSGFDFVSYHRAIMDEVLEMKKLELERISELEWQQAPEYQIDRARQRWSALADVELLVRGKFIDSLEKSEELSV